MGGDCGLDALNISALCGGADGAAVDIPRPSDEWIVHERVKLRDQIVEYLRLNPRLVKDELVNVREYVFENDAEAEAGVERYLEHMSMDGSWTGTPEFIAYADLKGRTVEVVTLDGGSTKIGEPESGAEPRPTLSILYHHGGTHFSALALRCTLPATPLPVEGAEARARHASARPPLSQT
jgi:hypothetical protein